MCSKTLAWNGSLLQVYCNCPLHDLITPMAPIQQKGCTRECRMMSYDAGCVAFLARRLTRDVRFIRTRRMCAYSTLVNYDFIRNQPYHALHTMPSMIRPPPCRLVLQSACFLHMHAQVSNPIVRYQMALVSSFVHVAITNVVVGDVFFCTGLCVLVCTCLWASMSVRARD